MARCGPGRLSRRTFCSSALAALCGTSAGCGTILYPERRGQPAGRLDWTVVALDAIGMLFFFVPGVIAFAVDFSNGTIYLPPDGYGQTPDGSRKGELRAVTLSTPEPTLAEIEQAVTESTGHAIRLEPGRYHTRELNSLDEFWTAEQAAWAGHQLPQG